MIIGITGGTGSGKATLLQVAQELGFQVLDCDAIYHGLLKTDAALLSTIEHRFPGVVEDGQLQRKKLGALVFADADALSAAETLVNSEFSFSLGIDSKDVSAYIQNRLKTK